LFFVILNRHLGILHQIVEFKNPGAASRKIFFQLMGPLLIAGNVGLQRIEVSASAGVFLVHFLDTTLQIFQPC